MTTTSAPTTPETPRPAEPPLNPRQRAAVEHGEGPLAVLAGAGTGKTRVLTHRIARLIREGVPPWQVLAVTFTNKAAGEMRERLVDLLGEDARTIWVGTFHAICARILRRYGTYVRLAPGFLIYDEADQNKLVDKLLKEAALDERVSPRQILARIGRAKDRGSDPTAPTGHPADDAVARIYPQYEARLAQENAVDFADLLLRTLELLGTEPAAEFLRDKFSHILIDEFQDTNLVQYAIVRGLSAGTRNLTVVGDDDQAIYAWRGAEPANLLFFERDHPGARLVKLEQNYRSTPVVLRCANAVISHNLRRHGKTLWTERKGGEGAVLYRADDDRQEAAFVASRIADFVGSGRVRASDCAVLYRTNQQSRVLEEALRRVQIPTRVIGGLSFFDRREVKDVLAYLRLVANPASDISFDRVVNVPTRGLGDATLGKLRMVAKSHGQGLLATARAAGAGAHSAALTALARKKLGLFARLIDDLTRAIRGGCSIAQLVTLTVEWSGLRARLESDTTVEGRERLGHLTELVSCATDFDDDLRTPVAPATRSSTRWGAESPAPTPDPWDEDPYIPRPARPASASSGEVSGAEEEQRDGGDAAAAEIARITSFLERLALSQPGDQEPVADAVQLLTIHVAKGLEWPVVFVTGLEDGLFPSLRDREDEVNGADVDGDIEEERRLLYVAITRARERLFLTHARTRRIWGEIRPCDPSRFLDELPRR